MATATGTYIAVDELRATLSSTTANYVSELRATGDTTTANLVRRMWLNDSSNIATIVWDVWETILRAYDFTMDSSGGYVEDYLSVASYALDVDDESYDLGYTVDPDYLDPNEYEDDIYETITITQEGTGETIEVEAVIAGRKVADVYYNRPTVTDYWIDDVSAVGDETVYLIVDWKQVITTVYDNDTYEDRTVTGSSVAAVVSGSSTIGAYIDDEGVFVPNAGTDYYTSDRIAYTIKKFSFYASDDDTTEYTFTQTIYVYQEANIKEKTGTSYDLSFTSSDDWVEATSGYVTLSVIPYLVTYYEYTSGADGGSEKSVATTTKVTLQRTSGNGTLSRTSITGQGTATYTMYSNSDEDEITHIIKASISSSVYETVEITQEAGSYEFYFEELNPISYGGGDYDIILVSKLNGEFVEVVEDSVVLSDGEVNYIEADESAGEYIINVTFPANSNSSTKTYTISAQQYGTGRTTLLEVTQEKKPASSVVTGSVSISNLVDSLYVSEGYLYGFNSYPIFKIVPSNGYLTCRYALKLDFEINTSNGNTYYAEYEHTMDYITLNSVGSTTSVQFANFPTYFDMQELTEYMFDPYSDNIERIVIRASLEWKSGSGILSLGSIDDNTWYVYN